MKLRKKCKKYIGIRYLDYITLSDGTQYLDHTHIAYEFKLFRSKYKRKS